AALTLATVVRLDANAFLEITADLALTAGARAGVVYDFYGPATYKFIVLDQQAGSVLFGHVNHGARAIDEVVAWSLAAGATYSLLVTIKGASVSVVINGAFVRSRAYNAALAAGRFGLIVEQGAAAVSRMRVRTDSQAASVVAPAARMALAASK